MSFLTDLDHLKLDAQFFPDHILHTEYISDAAKGQRKVKLERKWYKERELEEGGFSSVYLETSRNGSSKRAVKKIEKKWMDRYDIDYTRELKALAEFSKVKYRAEGIFVEFYGWFDGPDDMFFAMEYLPLGDLAKCVSHTLMENDVQQIANQTLQGLQIMHAEGFAHRDLKPKNILVVQTAPNWWIKLTDFGLSKRIEAGVTALRTHAGTQHYQAPEYFYFVQEADDESLEYTNAVDIWSVGCIIYRLLTGKVPFPSILLLKNFCKIPRDSDLFPTDALTGIMSANGIRFVKELMLPDPSRRPTATYALEDSWLQSSSRHFVAATGSAEQMSSPTDRDNSPSDLQQGIEKIGLYGSSENRPAASTSDDPILSNQAALIASSNNVLEAVKTLPPMPYDNFKNPEYVLDESELNRDNLLNNRLPSAETCTLCLTIISIEGLRKNVTLGQPNYSVLISVDDIGNTMVTKMIKGQNPRWDESFIIRVSEKSRLIFSVFDNGIIQKLVRRDFLGGTDFLASDILDLRSDPTKVTIARGLISPYTGQGKLVRGKIRVTLSTKYSDILAQMKENEDGNITQRAFDYFGELCINKQKYVMSSDGEPNPIKGRQGTKPTAKALLQTTRLFVGEQAADARLFLRPIIQLEPPQFDHLFHSVKSLPHATWIA